MACVFDEIHVVKDEGRDWWETIKRVPLKILDQDFGKEVTFTDLVQPEKITDDENLSGEDEFLQFDLDNLKRKSEVVQASGYSMVNFHADYFETEISSNQFENKDLEARIEKGFLIISGCQKGKVEGDGMLWRKFDRRYMLPQDCHISVLEKQLVTEKIKGGINVKVYKIAEKVQSSQKALPKKSPEKLKIDDVKKTIRSDDTRTS